MNDFLNEVEEDLKRERYEKLWSKYSPHLFGLIALIIAATAGFTYYQKQELAKSQALGSAYETALQMQKADGSKEAADQFAKIIGEGGRYKDLARVKLAGEMAEKDALGAIATLNAITNDTNVEKNIRDIALMKSIYLQSETIKSEEVKAKLSSIETSTSNFRFAAKELYASSLMREGKKDEALKAFNLILLENDAPSSLKSRITLLIATLQGK